MFFQIVSELTDFTVRTNETECHESLRNEAFAYTEDTPCICSFIQLCKYFVTQSADYMHFFTLALTAPSRVMTMMRCLTRRGC